MTEHTYHKNKKARAYFGGHLGIEPVEAKDGRSVMRLKIDPEIHHNPGNVLHGGVLASLADNGMGAAMVSAIEPQELCATVEFKINFLQMVREGVVTANTRIIKKGKRIAVLETEIVNEQNDIVAFATSTFMVFQQD